MLKGIWLLNEVAKTWTWKSWPQAIVLSLVLIVLRIGTSIIAGELGVWRTEPEYYQSQHYVFIYMFLLIVILLGVSFVHSDALFIQYLEAPFVLELIASDFSLKI